MLNMIRISVVMAVYNGESYVWNQIDSLLRFLSCKDEIIVSDDSSTDGTRLIVESLHDKRVVLLPQSDRLGYQKNFERAISFASGKFIFFSDQDDICLPERISRSLQALETHGCVFGDAIVTDESLHHTAPSYFAQKGTYNFTALHLFLKPSAIGATMACTRSFLSSALPFPRGVPHDQWISVLAAARGELQVVLTPLIMYRRHLGVASLTGLAKKRPLLLIAQERTRLLIALLFWSIKRVFCPLITKKNEGDSLF